MYLGIDLGTSSLKALVVSDTGEIVKSVSRNYPVQYLNQNWAEQNPDDWWLACEEVLQEIFSEYRIQTICFAGQMHGLVILDEFDNIIRPAILWCDQRTQKQCDRLNSLSIDIKKITGNQVLAGFTAPKLLWLKEKEAHNFAKIRKIMLPKDYLAYKLSGVFATDVSDASGTSMLDIQTRNWSSEVLDFLEIPISYLPKVCESKELIAQSNVLNQKVKVVIGGGDQAMAAIGIGAVEEGIVSVSLGTSGVVYSSSQTYRQDENYNLHSFCDASGKYHNMGVILSAASAYKWWVEQVNHSQDYEKFEQMAKSATAGSDCLFFLPYLLGERTPHNDPNAKGVFLGLTASHDQGSMTRAVLEGVSYALKDNFELLRDLGSSLEIVRISGGGAKSRVWKQILADILNIEIVSVNSNEGPAYGAAILSMVSVGKYPTVSQACDSIIKETERFYPTQNSSFYQKQYKIYQQLYPKLKEVYDLISAN